MQKPTGLKEKAAKGRKGFTVMFLILGSVALVIAGWAICSAHCNRKHFDHMLHIEAIAEPGSCAICHLDGNKTFAGLPILQNCMECHDNSDTQVWEQIETIMNRVTYEKRHPKI